MWKRLLFAGMLFVAVSFVTADSLFGLMRQSGEVVEIPGFVGMSEQEIMVKDHRIDVQTEYRYDSEVPAGTVIAQTPAAGSTRKISDRRKCEIRLTVSLGTEHREVPDVCGTDIREASALLRRSGFAVCEKSTDAEGAAGHVWKTEPAAGEEAALGSEVTVYVHAGKAEHTLTVPDLTGIQRGAALMQLYLNGLSAGSVTQEISDLPEGTVIRQSPVAGSEVIPGTAVRLVVASKGYEQQFDRNEE